MFTAVGTELTKLSSAIGAMTAQVIEGARPTDNKAAAKGLIRNFVEVSSKEISQDKCIQRFNPSGRDDAD